MTVATKAEAQSALNVARTKAQNASEAVRAAYATIPVDKNPAMFASVDFDAAQAHYQRCVRELEEAINEYARFDVSGDDE